eukprot:scaffold94155_cov73-Phaeocystis_antarctica.AAC.2
MVEDQPAADGDKDRGALDAVALLGEGRVVEQVEEQISLELEHLEEGERTRGAAAAQRRVVYDEVFVPYLRAHLDDALHRRQAHHLARREAARLDGEGDLQDEIGRGVAEVVDTVEQGVVALLRHLALQGRRHEQQDSRLALPPLRLLGGDQELAHAPRELLVTVAVTHEIVERVHALLPRRLVRVEVGVDARKLRDRRRPENRPQELAENADAVLELRHRRDVAVADGGDGHGRPVPAHEEPRHLLVLPDLAVSPIATEQVVIDPVGPIAVARKAPNEHPHARKPVAEEDQAGDEADQAQRGVRHRDTSLPPLPDA